MTDHPGTIQGESSGPVGTDWGAHASIHLAGGGGILEGFAGLHRGTLAQMVGMIRAMPEGDRAKYVIYKDNDHVLTLPEVMALAARSDFPLRGA
ncbi:hypothetical protein V5740_06880 [Croceibacterium sp. TMG7-5b_MA50]|uniref:hypothetical protein n=1 Tax=Croceibacterium sp. TMG7-5b_MA50 TaxID=3121290 RepID=UPI00322180C2